MPAHARHRAPRDQPPPDMASPDAYYETALDVAPGHVPSMQAMASLMVRAGAGGEELARLLDVLAMRGEDEEWRAWARDASARSIE